MIGVPRGPAFRLLLTGRAITTLGSAMAPIALAFAVLDLTGSPRDLGLVIGVRTLFNVTFLLFGGVLADRLPRHLLLVGTSVAAGLIQAAVAIVLLTGTATVFVLAALGAVNGVFSALAMPATAALLPQTVPEDLRQQANALNRLFFNAAMIVGASAGGLLVAAAGPGVAIAVDAVTFLVAAACFTLLRVAPLPVTSAAGGILSDLRTGWTEFVSRTWLWVVVAGFAVVNACLSGAFYVLGPVVADDTIGRRAWGFVLAAQTAGMIAGLSSRDVRHLRHRLPARADAAMEESPT